MKKTVIERYDISSLDMRIWTLEGFKKIKQVFYAKDIENLKIFKLNIEEEKVFLPDLFRVKTPRGYISAEDLSPENDAVVWFSEKNLNVLRTFKGIEEVYVHSTDEIVFIKTENEYVTKVLPHDENIKKYVCLNENGNRTIKRMADIKTGNFIQVSDEFKKIVCRKETEEELILVLNMNNNNYFLNNLAVVLDEAKVQKLLERKENEN